MYWKHRPETDSNKSTYCKRLTAIRWTWHYFLNNNLSVRMQPSSGQKWIKVVQTICTPHASILIQTRPNHKSLLFNLSIVRLFAQCVWAPASVTCDVNFLVNNARESPIEYLRRATPSGCVLFVRSLMSKNWGITSPNLEQCEELPAPPPRWGEGGPHYCLTARV